MTIVGGGIGGLALAAALDPARFDVTVLEAAPGRTALGAGIGLWPSARAALERIGAFAALRDVAAKLPPTSSLHDLRGDQLLALPSPDLRVVPRPALLAALAAAVPHGVRIEQRQVDDASALGGDLVVGADGVRSRVRGVVSPRAAPRLATPYVALRGTTEAVVSADRFGEYWGGGKLFGIVPMGPGRAYWFTTQRSAPLPEPLDVPAVLAFARAEFADAAPLVRRVLADAGPDTSATRMWLAPPMSHYVRGRYVVIGDAAHASLPNLGRGGCDAILDAVTLADTLNRGGTPARWQARRLPPTQAARVAASGVMRLALLHRGQAARDLVLGRLGRAT